MISVVVLQFTHVQGMADPGFSLGGGAKNMYAHVHHERETRPGSRALEALGVFYALSCYLSIIFKHSGTNWDKNIVDQILGVPAAPPLDSPLMYVILYMTTSKIL